MARQSFLLRRSTTAKGSYLQYPFDDPAYPSRTDNDGLLRADGVLVAPTGSGFVPEEGSFEVTVFDYRSVEIKWNVNLETELGVTPVPYQAFINYSPDGFPRSLNKGVTIQDTVRSGTMIHEVPGNKLWAYYTLFIRYLSSGDDDYYEPVAQLKAMLPTSYGSTDSLFARIPEHYQRLDFDEANLGEMGPLYRFLSIIGWDIDRYRTLMDYLMSMKDPQLAENEVLDMLSRDFGLDVETQELGVERVRNLIDSVGLMRRGKGTLETVQRTLRAITDCNVVYDPYASPTPTITVYAQRVNLIQDPRLRSGIIGSIDGGFPSSAYLPGFDLDAGVVGTAQTGGTYDGGDSVDPDFTGGGIGGTGGWLTYSDFSEPGTRILERVTPDVVAKTGDIFYFSAHVTQEIQGIMTGVYLYSGEYSNPLSDLVVESTSSVQVGNTKYWKLEVPEGYETYQTMAIVIRYLETPAYTVDDFDYFMLERGAIGEYFDGDTKTGSWVVDGGGAVSDYLWSGTVDASPSVYTDNLQRVKSTVARLIPSILPVNLLVTTGTVYSNRIPTGDLKYEITYNNIPGV